MTAAKTNSVKAKAGLRRGTAAERSSRRTTLSKVVGSVLGRHRDDICGLGAVVVGVVVAGGVWVSAMGPVGAAVDGSLALVMGLVRWLVPVLMVGAGIVLVRGFDRPQQPEAQEGAGSEASSELWIRALMGSGLVLLAVMGIAHVVRGRPGFDDSREELGAAGGVLGLAVGGPLHGLLSSVGAVLVMVFVAVVGLLVLTASSARTGVGAVTTLVKPPVVLIRRGLRVVFRDVGSGSGSIRPAQNPSSRFDRDADAPRAGPATDTRARSRDPQPPPSGPKRRLRQASADATPGPGVEPEPGTEPESVSGPAGSKWKLPSLELLAVPDVRKVGRTEVTERGELLQATLAKFGVPTNLLEPVVGPTVTRFVLELGEGVKVSKLESLRKDIALAMASPDVRILAPIPGQRAIGVEVPNIDREIVMLGDILRSGEARAARHPLQVAVGRDINGRSMMMNLAKMPHLLIAGATGAGKSSCLNSILTSILMRATPDQIRMILVDPKRVEMGQYDRAPHLLTAPVTDPRQAANALAWAVREMDRRYDLLSEVGFRDITGYNAAVNRGEVTAPTGKIGVDGTPMRYRRLPFVLVVVDELSDLMMVAARDVENSIARIAQMARAVGIHLVIATQRPSVDVITGIIKANVPARLAFAVSSLTDSRVILDQPGAERLVGRGDMLLLDPSSSAPHRIQGSWVEESEVRAVVGHWVDQASDFRADGAISSASAPDADSEDSGDVETVAVDPGGGLVEMDDITATAPSAGSDGGDELLDQAMELVVGTQLGSTSMLQRRLRVGFARAGRIMDLLEQRGVVGPSIGSKAREVLITSEELASRPGH